MKKDDFTDPIVPALAIPKHVPEPAPLGTADSGARATESLEIALEAAKELDISDDRVEIPELGPKDLPSCPQCGSGLLRPGVVWFGEALPQDTLDAIDEFLEEAKHIDLMLVVGTSGQVYPAAGYVEIARSMGAKIAVINMDPEDLPGQRHERKAVDWFFQGDAGVILPEILKEEIGELDSSASG